MAGELSNLQAPEGANRRSKHKGRGIGSGNGKTAGRGVKGQKARKSGNVRPGFEGGSMPLQRRLPKRGFSNHFEKDFAEVRVVHLNRFPEGTVVDEAMLKEAGLAKGRIEGVKIIGKGALTVRVDVKVNRISEGARGVIEAAGGKVELIPDRPKWTRPDSRKAQRSAKQG
ncbi:MAG: 50S ribosomal protein L15 [Deltaproteobacteria bacterium]|nr:50S ribosomal protein L15 [Deltaproteobacteria bacterium]